MAESQNELHQIPLWLRVARDATLLALLLACIAHGMLEVHSSNDTFIGLAAGRLILTSPEFPVVDTFSHTVPDGTVWLNQNWLTHVAQWWFYDRLGPNAVIYFTWSLVGLTAVFTLLAGYWRANTWVGAAIMASIVAFGLRDFVSARPATTGFFCFAAWWALICALEGQRERVRWWPIVLLFPLMLVWSNAHGSFVLGYGLLAAYLGHWFVQRVIGFKNGVVICGFFGAAAIVLVSLIASFGIGRLAGMLLAFAVYLGAQFALRQRPVLRDAQVYMIAGVTLLAAALVALMGPYGLDNFTHVTKVAGSDLWRQVSEWRPPYVDATFPPVDRFWAIFRGGLLLVLLAVPTALALNGVALRCERWRRVLSDYRTTLFDIAVVALALGLTFWARRFAPLLFIFAGPVVLVWLRIATARWDQFASEAGNRRMVQGVAAGIGGLALGATIAVSVATYRLGYAELVEPVEQARERGLLEREPDLFERVVRYDASPDEGFAFLRENALATRLFTEWTQAGIAMFHVPKVRVFKDGRAQQVYKESNFHNYRAVVAGEHALLDEFGTNAFLVRTSPTYHPHIDWLERSEAWVIVIRRWNYVLALRVDSEPFEQLCDRLSEGKAWYPDGAWPRICRAEMWMRLDPPKLDAAERDARAAMGQKPETAFRGYRLMTDVAIKRGELTPMWLALQSDAAALSAAENVPPRMRAALLRQISECRRLLQEAAAQGRGRLELPRPDGR